MSFLETEFDYVKEREDNWEEYRKELDKYEMREVYIPSLEREKTILFLKKDKEREYEMLQCSRSLGIKEEQENVDDLIKYIQKNELTLGPTDLERAKDLEVALDFSKINSVFEMGFRVPKLLNYYKNRGVESVGGYDIVNLNVLVSKKMGFDVHQKDFNDLENLDLSAFRNADLVLSYHVMEHVSRPDLLFKELFKNMKSGAYMHVEVPIEIDGPHLGHGHLYPFCPMELQIFSWIRDIWQRWCRGAQDYSYGNHHNVYERYGTQSIHGYQYLVIDSDGRDQYGVYHTVGRGDVNSIEYKQHIAEKRVSTSYAPPELGGGLYEIIVPVGTSLDLYHRLDGFVPSPNVFNSGIR